MLSHLANNGFSKQQVDKIGNSIIYFSDKLEGLTKTKILKLLYILEESSIRKYGYPFFGVDFQLWKHGPVLKDIFIDLSEEQPSILKSYIERNPDDPTIFKNKQDFIDDEFSQNDIDLLEKVVAFARTKTAAKLVQHLHGPNSLWRRSAIKYGILELLENETVNSTEFDIDFNILFENNSEMLERYESAKENLEFIKSLKR
jgi:uncharacterized phage-associated protein